MRISLGGGGTDLPSYYRAFGGEIVSAAIDKYVYVAISKPFEKGIFLKYSKIETVKNIYEIEHPIIRETLLEIDSTIDQIEISSIADIPAGTGLGSSGSFTTSLIKGLYTFTRKSIHARELADLACHIEIEKLEEPIGKQDQFISAFGGITSFKFHSNDKVDAVPLKVSSETLHELEENLILFYTKKSRSASTILRDQDTRSKNNESESSTIQSKWES